MKWKLPCEPLDVSEGKERRDRLGPRWSDALGMDGTPPILDTLPQGEGGRPPQSQYDSNGSTSRLATVWSAA